MADKDYSGTPLSQKLGARPGVQVVVFFTTSRADLEQRFAGLKDALGPADGLWIAWPKKAAKIETDLSFQAVQELGLEHGVSMEQLPIWIPEAAWSAWAHTSGERALAAGLVHTPLVETIHAILDHAQPVDGVGLTEEREAELLAAWHAR